ncbi:arrestin [Byssothecium circinans]|uniref:Arrestin n=1 Tax=Byssothecium circinans TaxID=147558 RepID=A0A6A5T679_9PLEO|nr:arrestin [Byssothecium circinans]KAF1948133.1 arrestin [Byssothecium circinans]
MPPRSSRVSAHSGGMTTFSSQVHYRMLQMAHMSQPDIDIQLDDSQGSYVTSYSTMDTMEGTVTITPQHDTRFEDVQIVFTGTAQVYVERLTPSPTMSGRAEASHRFLTLKQPIDDSDLPTPRILLAGKKYVFPFYFTVPAHLLPSACSHKVVSDYVLNTHLMLPPSLGDAELSGFGGSLLDDMAPEMAKINYAIKVRILQFHESKDRLSVLVEKARKVRIKPVFEEQPPLNMDEHPEYRARCEKAIKKGLFKGKLGTLTAQSRQPKAMIIPGARTTNEAPPSTRARVLLRFDPTEEHHVPPCLGSLKTNIKVTTYYACTPRSGLPSRSHIGYDITQGVFAESTTISTLCIASAQWEKHPASEDPILCETNSGRRDSGMSTLSTISNTTFDTGIPLASKNYKGGDFYTASILVPVTKTDNKNFIPTFHSCLISRTYTLNMSLSVHAPGVSDPTLNLNIPLQVCAEGSVTGNENARARSAEAVALEDASRMFVPRSVAPPSNADAPPEYVAFPSHVGRHNARVTVVG